LARSPGGQADRDEDHPDEEEGRRQSLPSCLFSGKTTASEEGGSRVSGDGHNTLNFGEIPYSTAAAAAAAGGGGGGSDGGGGGGGSDNEGGPGDQVSKLMELQQHTSAAAAAAGLPGSYGLYRNAYGGPQEGFNRGPPLGGYSFPGMQNPYSGYHHLGYPGSQSPGRDGKNQHHVVLHTPAESHEKKKKHWNPSLSPLNAVRMVRSRGPARPY